MRYKLHKIMRKNELVTKYSLKKYIITSLYIHKRRKVETFVGGDSTTYIVSAFNQLNNIFRI